jgi:hypothetical protein
MYADKLDDRRVDMQGTAFILVRSVVHNADNRKARTYNNACKQLVATQGRRIVTLATISLNHTPDQPRQNPPPREGHGRED